MDSVLVCDADSCMLVTMADELLTHFCLLGQGPGNLASSQQLKILHLLMSVWYDFLAHFRCFSESSTGFELCRRPGDLEYHIGISV